MEDGKTKHCRSKKNQGKTNDWCRDKVMTRVGVRDKCGRRKWPEERAYYGSQKSGGKAEKKTQRQYEILSCRAKRIQWSVKIIDNGAILQRVASSKHCGCPFNQNVSYSHFTIRFTRLGRRMEDG